jgi:hypothetical protein
MRFRLVILAALIVACGGESTTSPSGSYADISGSFSGPIAFTSQGVTLNATMSLTITQSGGSISGTDALVGTVNGIPASGTGTFTGTVAAGSNPSVNVTTSSADCPALHSQYSGSYDSANRRLTMTGPLYITNPDCSVALTYPLTLILNK